MRIASDVTDPRLVRALSHELRVRILGALDGRVANPSQLAESLDAPLGNVAYHVRTLASLGMIRLVKTTPRRGSVEHYYEVAPAPR
jgi:DNA-binding transcriptional ArsR family regulator